MDAASTETGSDEDSGPDADEDAGVDAACDAGSLLSPDEAIAAAKIAIAVLCNGYTSDPELCHEMRSTCQAGSPRTPYLTVLRQFTCDTPGCTDAADDGRYYIVPFDVPDGGTGCEVSISIDTLAHPGDLMSVRTSAPITYLPLAQDAARTILAEAVGAAETSLGPSTLVDYIATEDCGWSEFFPMWKFRVGGKIYYVTQLGAVKDTIARGLSGGG